MARSRIGPRAKMLLAAAAGSALAFAVGDLSAAAASAGVFPVKTGLVPLVVAAAFVAPALLAAFWSSVRRASGRFANVVALTLLVVAAAGVTVYARPDLLAVIRV